MSFFLNTLRTATRNLTRTLDTWGRVVDRTIFSGLQPEYNPDPVDENSEGTRYFKAANNAYVKAGLNYRDVSRLFVSAAGLEPDESGAYFPAQLLYTTPGPAEPLQALAEQYDEGFDGGFANILRELQMPAMEYGRAIAEIDWYPHTDGLRASMIWSRDPEKYLINPPNYKPGIYQKDHTYSTASTGNVTRMPDGKFFVVTFDSLYNNPYGQSVLRPIIDMVETWDTVYNAWRAGLMKSGYGATIIKYGPIARGQDSHAIAERNLLIEQAKKIANGTVTVLDEGHTVEPLTVQLQAQAFLDFHTSFVQAVSVLLTGSATALIEGKFGSFAKEESTTTRQKSDKEQADALLLGNAFTYNFNRFWMTLNYGPDAIIPQLQLIRPELIMPTTPQGQETQDDIEREEIEVQMEEAEEPAEMAEGEDEEEQPIREYRDFPDSSPEPPIYADVEDAAREFLEAMPVKNYNDVTPNEAPSTFTVKRLRNFDEAQGIMERMKAAIVETLGAATEDEAWQQYVRAARGIFDAVGLPWSTSLESDLIISFRQARQSAYQAGIDALIESEGDRVTGIETVTMEDGRVRPVHALWHGIVLAPDDPRRERLRKPMDFGCRCNDIPVFDNEKPLTPENEIPDIFPGESYRGYVA